jgi:hypothetical protein
MTAKPTHGGAAPAFTPTVADDLFEAILDAHEGLTAAQSQQLNARLVLTLAARLADLAAVQECIAQASDASPKAG